MVNDRRDSYRLTLDKDQVRIEKPKHLKDVRFDNISGSGASLTIPMQMNDIGKSPIVLNLGDHSTIETSVIPIYTKVMDRMTTVGVKFDDMAPKHMGSLSKFLFDCLLEQNQKESIPGIDDSLSILKDGKKAIKSRFLYYCKSQGSPIRIYSDKGLLPFKLYFQTMTEFNNQEFIQLELERGNETMLETTREYTFAFSGVNAVNYFSSVLWRKESGSLLITFPSQIRQSGFRNSLRVALDPDKKVQFIINHPRLEGGTLNKPVIEVGARGFSFPLDPGHDILFPGELIKNAVLVLPEGPVNVNGIIKSIRDHEGRLVCGFEIINFVNQEERLRWRTYVLLSTYKNLKIGKKEDAAIYWEILESSDYIDKEVTQSLKQIIKDNFFLEWEKHSENYKITRNLLYMKNGKAVGTFSMSLLYPRTGLSHHMSVDKLNRKSFFEIGRELISGIHTIFQNIMLIEYFVSYFYADKTFNDLLFRRFLEAYPKSEDFVYDRYHLYKCLLSYDYTNLGPKQTSIEVIPQTPALLRRLTRFLRENISPLEYKAFSYNEDEITLEAFSRQCLSNGYERKRRIFFAMENEKPIAALIAETGDIGINIFNLLNSCWIVFFTQEARQNEKIIEGLILHAMNFFRMERKAEFLFLDFNNLPRKILENYGIQYFTDGMRWIGNNNITAVYLNYIEENLRMIYNRYRPY